MPRDNQLSQLLSQLDNLLTQLTENHNTRNNSCRKKKRVKSVQQPTADQLALNYEKEDNLKQQQEVKDESEDKEHRADKEEQEVQEEQAQRDDKDFLMPDEQGQSTEESILEDEERRGGTMSGTQNNGKLSKKENDKTVTQTDDTAVQSPPEGYYNYYEPDEEEGHKKSVTVTDEKDYTYFYKDDIAALQDILKQLTLNVDELKNEKNKQQTECINDELNSAQNYVIYLEKLINKLIKEKKTRPKCNTQPVCNCIHTCAGEHRTDVLQYLRCAKMRYKHALLFGTTDFKWPFVYTVDVKPASEQMSNYCKYLGRIANEKAPSARFGNCVYV